MNIFQGIYDFPEVREIVLQKLFYFPRIDEITFLIINGNQRENNYKSFV